MPMRYVYCHPLFDERKCAHRFSFRLKQTFRAAGLALERFDYHGTGEAKGKFSDVLLGTLREDIARQVGDDKVCLIGVRFGASLAFDYCAGNAGQVRKLILVEPIVGGAGYIDYLYRKQHIKDLMTGDPAARLDDNGYKNIEGYKTNIRLIEQIRGLHLIETARERSIKSSVFIAQISKESKINTQIADLATLLKSSAEQVLVENIELPQFWERIPIADYHKLTGRILEWCRG